MLLGTGKDQLHGWEDGHGALSDVDINLPHHRVRDVDLPGGIDRGEELVDL